MRSHALPLLLAGVPLLLVGCDSGGALPTTPSEVRFSTASSSAKTSSKLKVDQSNLVTDGLGVGNGRWFQTFTPKADNLAQVDLLLIVNLVPPQGEFSTLYIFSDITQTEIDSAFVFVAGPAPGELTRTVSYQFGVDHASPLNKGTTYALGLDASPNVSWEFGFGDPYPSGQAIGSDGVPINPPADFVFTTYASKK